MEGLGLNENFWRHRRVLVTGHTGFKGAWLALWLQRLGAHVAGLALTPEAGAAYDAMAPWTDLDSHRVDLRDGDAVAATVAGTRPDVVFHLGAQALVRRAHARPEETMAVNVAGTANLLTACLAPWSTVGTTVVVTSDKVYATNGAHRPFREDDSLGGDDPYARSKVLVEGLVAGARRTSGGAVGLATARAGNVVGGGDRGADRLLPDLWRSAEGGRPARLRYPGATRPWQFVLEPVAGYLLLAEHLAESPEATPGAVNFGPDLASCWPVRTVAERVVELAGRGCAVEAPGDDPPETEHLAVDATLARTALGWRPRLDAGTALAWTVEWWTTAAKGGDLRALASSQIDAYESR